MEPFIIVGKYKISKQILMSEPARLYVTNTETNECEVYLDIEIYN